jgi:hypothetical protein
MYVPENSETTDAETVILRFEIIKLKKHCFLEVIYVFVLKS